MIQVFTHSEAGGHIQNEDAFEVRRYPLDPDCLLVAVADGQGGQPGGGPAAVRACKAAIDCAVSFSAASLLHPRGWTDILARADREVTLFSRPGFTTLIAFVVYNGRIVGASNGDSAVVLLSANTPPFYLTKHQFKNPPVGSGEARFVSFGSELIPPWTVLTMTDGVWKYAGWENIVRLGGDSRGEDIAAAIRNCAQMRNGELQDDFTLVVLRDTDE